MMWNTHTHTHTKSIAHLFASILLKLLAYVLIGVVPY